jgi:hypothetical protein
MHFASAFHSPAMESVPDRVQVHITRKNPESKRVGTKLEGLAMHGPKKIVVTTFWYLTAAITRPAR